VGSSLDSLLTAEALCLPERRGLLWEIPLGSPLVMYFIGMLLLKSDNQILAVA
jgi:hypothetical protein